MKLKTTAILAVCGVLSSAAGAFAIPVGKPAIATADPAVKNVLGSGGDGRSWDGSSGSRISAIGPLTPFSPGSASGDTWIAAGTLPDAPDMRPSVTSATR